MSREFPKFLYDNRLNDATPAASTTATGDFNVLYLRDMRPYTWWKPTAMAATVTVDSASPRLADYAALFGHTLHTDDAVVLVERSTDNFVASNVCVAMSNALAYPEDFSNAIWVKTNSAVTANLARAPDGTWTADFLNEDATATQVHQVAHAVSILPNSITASYSVYAKASTRTWIALNAVNKANTACSAYFNLGTGAVGTTSNCTAQIESMGDGWYRCQIFFAVSTGATTPSAKIQLATGDTGNTYSGDGASGVYLWGAQLSQGTTAYQGNADGALLFAFTEASYRYTRFRFANRTGTDNPSIAIAMVGTSLQSPVGLAYEFDPIGIETIGQANRSQRGYPLGRVIEFEEWSRKIELRHVTQVWLRNYFRPAWDAHLKHTPFLFSWDPGDHPRDIYLVQSEEKYEASHTTPTLADLMLELVGVAA